MTRLHTLADQSASASRLQIAPGMQMLPTLASTLMGKLTSNTLPPVKDVWGKRVSQTQNRIAPSTDQTIYMTPTTTLEKSCRECKISFISNDKLLAHKIEHSLGKHFRCIICNKLFSQKINMKSHMKSVHLKLKHPCTICGMLLSSKTNLWHHRTKTHAPIEKKNKLIRCTLCDTEMRGDLARHQQTKCCKKKTLKLKIIKDFNKAAAHDEGCSKLDETAESDSETSVGDLVICSDEE